jgi:hypothetical protein
MHDALRAMLTDTMTKEAYTGQDSYGKPTFASPVSLAARVQFLLQRVVDATGQERVSRATVFVNGDVVIDLRDRLTFADGTSSPILRLYSPKDLNGAIDHWEISF